MSMNPALRNGSLKNLTRKYKEKILFLAKYANHPSSSSLRKRDSAITVTE